MDKFVKKIFHQLPDRYQKVIKKYYHALECFFHEVKYYIVFAVMKNKKITSINMFEKKVFSQNGEDGIIELIFHKIGSLNGFCVEFGVQDARECNTRYLIEKKGWQYLHMDGDEHAIAYSNIQKEFITAENINLLFRKYKVPKEFDLLSIDIDSNDYWVWKAVSGYRPRVVIIEYNSSIPPNESKGVEYNPKAVWDHTRYFRASLLALATLGRKKGYTLIGCESRGVNAFFVRNDLVQDRFVIKKVEQVYKPPRYGKKINGRYVGHPPSDKVFISM